MLRVPGSMAHLPYRWSETDCWKDRVFAPLTDAADGSRATVVDGVEREEVQLGVVGGYTDDRIERHPTPQYQTDADATAARLSHGDQDCLICAGIDF